MKNFKELREKYRSKFPPSLVAAAVKIALDMGGAMTPAVKKIERMKKGLSDDPIVKDALRQANESVKEGTVQEGTWEIPQTHNTSTCDGRIVWQHWWIVWWICRSSR